MSARFLPRLTGAALAAAISIPAGALDLYFGHSYGEFVDRGDVAVSVSSNYNLPPDCGAGIAVAQIGKLITLTLRRAANGTPLGQCGFMTESLSPLAAGDYMVTAQLLAEDGSIADTVTKPLRILPIEGRCNPNPLLSPSIYGTPRNQSAAQFVARVQTDAVFAASLGNPAVSAAYGDFVNFDYPPLEDIPPAMDRLVNSGTMASVGRNGYTCFSAAPPDTTAQVFEFFNVDLDHYFYTRDAGEIAAIEAGKVGPGWSRTGKSFKVVTELGCAYTSDKTAVYRFFGIPGIGPNSHFFTQDRAECHVVDKSAQWSFEGAPFYASAPQPDGTCATKSGQPQVPLYRVWRPFGDSNHRFTTERAVVNEMVNKGWVDEGPAMCVLPSI